MRYPKILCYCGLAIGFALSGGTILSAQDWDGRDTQRHIEHDGRDLRHDHGRVNRLRADIANDRERLDYDIRSGHERAAAHQARDLARDQRALRSQYRDIDRDRRDIDRDRYRERRFDWR